MTIRLVFIQIPKGLAMQNTAIVSENVSEGQPRLPSMAECFTHDDADGEWWCV